MMTMMKQVQPPLRAPSRRDQAISDLDPATLGATLRELANRVHRFVRAIERSGTGLKRSQQELTALHAEIFRLQSNLDSQQLDSLAKYTSAMRERLEHVCPELFLKPEAAGLGVHFCSDDCRTASSGSLRVLVTAHRRARR
jgi:septal ring factor EnvC (AmiA/AmiB activator)